MVYEANLLSLGQEGPTAYEVKKNKILSVTIATVFLRGKNILFHEWICDVGL